MISLTPSTGTAPMPMLAAAKPGSGAKPAVSGGFEALLAISLTPKLQSLADEPGVPADLSDAEEAQDGGKTGNETGNNLPPALPDGDPETGTPTSREAADPVAVAPPAAVADTKPATDATNASVPAARPPLAISRVVQTEDVNVSPRAVAPARAEDAPDTALLPRHSQSARAPRSLPVAPSSTEVSHASAATIGPPSDGTPALRQADTGTRVSAPDIPMAERASIAVALRAPASHPNTAPVQAPPRSRDAKPVESGDVRSLKTPHPGQDSIVQARPADRQAPRRQAGDAATATVMTARNTIVVPVPARAMIRSAALTTTALPIVPATDAAAPVASSPLPGEASEPARIVTQPVTVRATRPLAGALVQATVTERPAVPAAQSVMIPLVPAKAADTTSKFPANRTVADVAPQGPEAERQANPTVPRDTSPARILPALDDEAALATGRELPVRAQPEVRKTGNRIAAPHIAPVRTGQTGEAAQASVPHSPLTPVQAVPSRPANPVESQLRSVAARAPASPPTEPLDQPKPATPATPAQPARKPQPEQIRTPDSRASTRIEPAQRAVPATPALPAHKEQAVRNATTEPAVTPAGESVRNKVAAAPVSAPVNAVAAARPATASHTEAGSPGQEARPKAAIPAPDAPQQTVSDARPAPIPMDGPAPASRPGPAATLAVPGQPAQVHDFSEIVGKLAEARESAGSPVVRTTLTHQEFGPVSLQLRTAGDRLDATLASADPEFNGAARSAAIAAAGTLSGDTGNTAPRQDAPGGQHSQTATTQSQSQAQSQAQAQNQTSSHGQHGARGGETAQTRAGNPAPQSQDETARPRPRSGIYA